MDFVIGVDTGGTFTDVVVIDADGKATSGKAFTTPSDLAQGVFDALADVATQLDLSLQDLLRQAKIFRFSGTTATNALLTRSGAKVGMLTTAGFEDTLHIGRGISGWAGLTEEQVRHAYRQQKPEPLVPKSLIRGVSERVDWKGSEVVALNLQEVQEAVHELIGAGVNSIVICFLWSVRNGEHELAVQDLIARQYPEIYLAASHQIAPSLGEYERFATTVIDAFIGPELIHFLHLLESTLREKGFTGQVLVAQADGGCLYANEARPAYTLQSGPAAGVIATKTDGEILGYSNVIATDVGGTSFDVGLIAEGTWMYARDPVIGKFHVSFPMIEIASIGAGGGSVAWVDSVGVLHVGPRSAGSSPGPACYGRGGTAPTVTDANLLLGYLNPENFLGGRVKLDIGQATSAIQQLAEPLGMDLLHAAAGVYAIATAHMAALLASRVTARGYDPRDFSLFSYGGAGGAHAAYYGAELGVREVVVPALAATFSALGVATAPLLHCARLHDFAAMPMEPERFNGNFRKLEAEVVERLDRDRIPAPARELVFVLEMRYGVQVHTVRFRVPWKLYSASDIAGLCSDFDQLYETHYGKGSAYVQAGQFVTSMIVEGYGHLPAPERPRRELMGESPAEALVGNRGAYFNGQRVSADIYRAERLQAGNVLPGPAIIESAQTTVVIPPNHSAWVDQYHNLRIRIPHGKESVNGPITGPIAAA